jgi:hypothetical protein
MKKNAFEKSKQFSSESAWEIIKPFLQTNDKNQQ